MDAETMRGRGHGRTIVIWVAANLLLGYGAAFPLTTAVVFSYYVRAKVWGTVAAPYHAAEAQASVILIVVLGGLLMAASALVNRAGRRRLELRGGRAAGFWLATVALQLVPFGWFVLGTDRTFPELLTMGLLR